MKLTRSFQRLKAGRYLWRLSGEFVHLLSGAAWICLIDQLFKHSVDSEPEENFPRELPGSKGKVLVTRAHNPGFSMGRLGKHPEFVKLSSLAMTGFLAGILHFLCMEFPRRMRLEKLGVALVIGGAMSNVLDRARKGAVTDYLHIQAGILKKAIVNIGDLAIYLGGALYLLGALFTALTEREE